MATLNFPDSPSTGDVYKDGNSGFSYEWNGTVWISTDPSTASNIREIDDISSGFDGSDTTFTLQVAGVNVEPVNVQQLIISVGGVMQNAGDDYTVSGSTLTFTTAPTSGLTFFGTLLGTALSLNTVADGTVGTSSFEMPLTIGDANDSTTIPGNAVVSGILTAANAYVTGILTAQTLNYNNVTDIYSSGIITATRGIQQTGNEGLHVSAGITTVGILTATSGRIGLGVTINNTGIDAGAGVVTAFKAELGIGVTINNTGIDAGNAGIMTAGTVSAPSNLKLSLDTTEKARLDSSGRLLVGATGDDNGTGALMQVAATAGTAAFSANRYTNTADGPSRLYLFKSRATSIGGQTIVQDGDDLGEVVFQGSDGTDATQAALIRAEVDGTPGNNDMPGSLSIHTTQDGNAAPTEALRVDSSQRFLIGTTAGRSAGGVNAQSQVEGTSYQTSSLNLISNAGATAGGVPHLTLAKSRGSSDGSSTIVADGDFLGTIQFVGADGVDLANIAAHIQSKVDGTPGADDMPGSLLFGTTADGATSPTERLKITSTGGFSFDNGQLVERVKIVSGKLSDNTSIDLINGMVYYFTTTETTTLAPNIRIDGSNTLNDAMDTGDVISVTLVTTAAAASYINQLNIDGSSQTVEWAGAEAPSAGGDGGLDVNAFTIIKTAANTYKVLGNYTNFD